MAKGTSGFRDRYFMVCSFFQAARVTESVFTCSLSSKVWEGESLHFFFMSVYHVDIELRK